MQTKKKKILNNESLNGLEKEISHNLYRGNLRKKLPVNWIYRVYRWSVFASSNTGSSAPSKPLKRNVVADCGGCFSSRIIHQFVFISLETLFSLLKNNIPIVKEGLWRKCYYLIDITIEQGIVHLNHIMTDCIADKQGYCINRVHVHEVDGGTTLLFRQ